MQDRQREIGAQIWKHCFDGRTGPADQIEQATFDRRDLILQALALAG